LVQKVKNVYKKRPFFALIFRFFATKNFFAPKNATFFDPFLTVFFQKRVVFKNFRVVFKNISVVFNRKTAFFLVQKR